MSQVNPHVRVIKGKKVPVRGHERDTPKGTSSVAERQATAAIPQDMDPMKMDVPMDVHFASMGNEEKVQVVGQNDKVYTVSYYSEQATGDNGKPAKGYHTGVYEVDIHGPDGKREDIKFFRHTPQGPTLDRAQPYAAGQAADYIKGSMFPKR